MVPLIRSILPCGECSKREILLGRLLSGVVVVKDGGGGVLVLGDRLYMRVSGFWNGLGSVSP